MSPSSCSSPSFWLLDLGSRLTKVISSSLWWQVVLSICSSNVERSPHRCKPLARWQVPFLLWGDVGWHTQNPKVSRWPAQIDNLDDYGSCVFREEGLRAWFWNILGFDSTLDSVWNDMARQTWVKLEYSVRWCCWRCADNHALTSDLALGDFWACLSSHWQLVRSVWTWSLGWKKASEINESACFWRASPKIRLYTFYSSV